MGAGGLQVGRDSERERLVSVLRASASGHPGAVLVAGEPGIGKTSLVAEVTSGPAAAEHRVLWGRCLRFAADSSPYLPIGQVLTQWYRQSDESERARVLTGAEHLATIAPALGATSGPADSGRVVPLVALVLDRVAEPAPLVVVVDDVQWADGSSLDLLAYLVAGFGEGERLSLVVTYRDTELGEGHRLHGWLADVARLPSVSRLRLERLRLADAEELVARLRGGDDGGRLAIELFERSDGNPYYTELLVRAAADEPGSQQDDGLRQALLSSWHRLDPDARELLQLLAIGGRPVSVGVLERLVAARGGATGTVTVSLAASTAAGLTTTRTDGGAWFHHPLVAEVVATTLDPAARRLVHREYVEVLESSFELATASRAAHLALHHHGAGDPDRAFRWSLRAADEAAAVRGYAEVCEHLHRACRLWEDAGDGARATGGNRVDLWQRASEAAWSAGEHLLGLTLREEAVALADAADDPVRGVRLRLPLQDWRNICGFKSLESVEDARPALELAKKGCPGTPEHAQALAKLAHAEVWNEDEDAAVSHAVAAVRMARRTGSSEALAWALAMRSETPPWSRALDNATRALTLAREVGDPRLLGWATTRTANRLQRLGRGSEAGELLLTVFQELVAVGSVHDAMYAAPAYGVTFLVEFGRWDEADTVLRLLLSHRLTTGNGALTRGVAAWLAVLRGDFAAGHMHLARARELQPRTSRAGDFLEFIEVEAEWALGRPREALGLAEQLMPAQVTLDPAGGDELLVMAARAAGDLAEQPGAREEAVAVLDRIEGVRGGEPPCFESMGVGDVIHPARRSLFEADRARCHGTTDTAPLWRAAVTSCSNAGMVWHEALASYRLARALLVERGPRGEAASALRRAATIATGLGAAPIVRDVEELARQAHIPLAEPASPQPATGASDDPLSSLTAREREVLSHLVVGRTYGEIAQALFISEKTVSVHVSNLLRKTGTTSRLEVAELARRTSSTA